MGGATALRAALQDIADAEGMLSMRTSHGFPPQLASSRVWLPRSDTGCFEEPGRAEEAPSGFFSARPRRNGRGSYLTDDLYYPGLEPR